MILRSWPSPVPDDLGTCGIDKNDYYERYWSASGYNLRREVAPEELRPLFAEHVRPVDDCLDVGCGDGANGVYLAAHAHSYVGVDVSQTAVDLTRARGLKALRVTGASALPFDDHSFDIVVCVEVFEHLFTPQLAAAEARRVLRPDGRLIVTVPNAAYWRDRIDALFGVWQPGGDDRGRAEPWRSPHIRFFRPATLKQMLMDAGFVRVDVAGLPSPLLGRIPIVRQFSRRPGLMARAAARMAPSLLAGGITAVAVR